jgi:metal-responsive CopG/Arc/MetJ family transcriptional regulator
MKTKEEMFTRQTYLIRNELINRFDNAAKNRRKGFKTEVINKILENFLEENEL